MGGGEINSVFVVKLMYIVDTFPKQLINHIDFVQFVV